MNIFQMSRLEFSVNCEQHVVYNYCEREQAAICGSSFTWVNDDGLCDRVYICPFKYSLHRAFHSNIPTLIIGQRTPRITE